MKLCVYTMTVDYGFAPNPFFDYCTLAACTPNHQNATLCRGDWLVGRGTAARGRRLIYAEEVSEVTDFDTYHADQRFAQKIPQFDQTWREACGDNIYHRNEDSQWVQAPTIFHNTPRNRQQDTDHPIVFIATRYFYFGEHAPEIPAEFTDILRNGRGIWYAGAVQAQGFLDWLQSTYAPGIHGNPRDLNLWLQDGEFAPPPDCSPGDPDGDDLAC